MGTESKVTLPVCSLGKGLWSPYQGFPRYWSTEGERNVKCIFLTIEKIHGGEKNYCMTGITEILNHYIQFSQVQKYMIIQANTNKL